MKRTFKGLLAIASLAVVAVGSFLLPSSAQAAIRTCAPYSGSLTGYPYTTGNLYFCLPAPQNSAETNLQTVIKSSSANVFPNFTSISRTELQNKNVKWYIFYNGQDAIDTLKSMGLSASEPGPKPTETGRTFSVPSASGLPAPTSAIFVYNTQQWNAMGGAIPTQSNGYSGTQLIGTIRHETGHEFDRIFGLDIPLSGTGISITNTDTNFAKAIAWDAADMTAADIAAVTGTQYYDTSTGIKWNEVFAESIASKVGGGAKPSDGTNLIRPIFKCTYWYVDNLYTSVAGSPPKPTRPAAPSSTACYGHTTW